MARFDKVLSPLRVEAAAALDGTAGVDGNGDLIVVGLDAAGRLILPGAVDNCYGVILTTEKTRNTHYTTAAAQKQVVGGQRYTVMRQGEILDAAAFDTPLSAGDKVYCAADGTFGAAPGGAGAIYVGTVIPREEDSTELRLCVDINGQPVGTV